MLKFKNFVLNDCGILTHGIECNIRFASMDYQQNLIEFYESYTHNIFPKYAQNISTCHPSKKFLIADWLTYWGT